MRVTYVTYIVLLTLTIHSVRGQTLDSLKEVLENVKTEEEEIDALKKIGRYLSVKADTHSLFYYNKLLAIGARRKDKELQAIAYNGIGNAWADAKDLKQSSKAYYKGIEFTEDDPQFHIIRTRLYANLGWNYIQFKNPEKALKYFQEAEKYARLSNDEHILGHFLNNLGVVEFDLKLYEESLESLTESLRLNRKLNNTLQERFNLNNMGKTLTQLGRLKAAEDTLQKVLVMNQKLGDTVEIVSNMINLSTIYHNKNQYAKATKMLLAALNLGPGVKSKTKLGMYQDLSRLFKAQKDYKNVSLYQAKYITLNDSVAQLRFHEYSLELDRRYENAMEERDLVEAKKNIAEQRLYLALTFSAFILLFFGAAFLWGLFIAKKRNEKLLISLNLEIEARARDLAQANKNIQAMNDNLENMVSERTLIIKEQNQRLIQFGWMNSHEIRGPIATIMGLINLLQNNTNPEDHVTLVGYLKKSSNKLDSIVREMTKRLEKEGLAPSETRQALLPRTVGLK